MGNNQITQFLLWFALATLNILSFGSVFCLAKATNKIIPKILIMVLGLGINILALIGLFNPANSPIQGSIKINYGVISYAELVTLITYPVLSFTCVFCLTKIVTKNVHKIAVGVIGFGLIIFSYVILINPTGQPIIR